MSFIKKLLPCLFKKKEDKVIFINENTKKWSKDELYLLVAVNKIREEAGLNKLIMDDTCYTLAHTRNTLNIDKGGIPSHKDFPKVFKILIDLGCSWAGENLAYKYKRLSSVINSWYKSEAHKKNMLRADWIYTGIAVSSNKDGDKYYCQIFCK